MDIGTLFSDSKWRILAELSNGKLSPTELAKKTGTSLANISTQLRLLEALEFVQKEDVANITKGEARKRYSLKKEFGYLILGSHTVMGKKMFNLDDDSLFFFKVWLINDRKAPQVLIKLYTQFEELLRNVDSIGYLGIRGDELEIVLINDSIDDLRFLNDKKLEWQERNYKIKAHLHTYHSFEQGINVQDEYFTSLLKKVFIITDKDQTLSNLKKR
jgi:hypothetical protein